ncbi:MAG TPA: hypothetical protein VM389_00820 [Phycisphaerae bacterium]|nr:hypothetical protein [Phycisphaerae bacterium]
MNAPPGSAKQRRGGAVLLACLPILLLGCTPGATTVPVAPKGGWVPLFDGKQMRQWAVLQGEATAEDGVIVINADGRRISTIAARTVHLRNGELELTVRRRAAAEPDAPYTIALRTTVLWRWSSIYFVCRPEYLDVCNGSCDDPFPREARRVPLAPADGAEVWRFVMDEGTIDCYRFGQKIVTYRDAGPCSGTIALTADRCALEVLDVRYLPAAEE